MALKPHGVGTLADAVHAELVDDAKHRNTGCLGSAHHTSSEKLTAALGKSPQRSVCAVRI